MIDDEFLIDFVRAGILTLEEIERLKTRMMRNSIETEMKFHNERETAFF